MRGPLITLLALGLVAGCGSTPTPEPAATSSTFAAATPAAAPSLTVTNVVDGDTVDLSDGRRVRVLGIDSPERGECGFEQATTFARMNLLGKGVEVATDPTQDEVDSYGRALLYLEPDPGTLDYSVAIARAGWARSYIFQGKPVQKAGSIDIAEDEARRARRGIWGALCVTATPAPAPQPSPSPSPSPKPRPAPAPQDNDDDDDARRPAPAPKREEDSGGGGSAYYKNCAAARAAGAAPVRRGDPGYSSRLDRDGDGVGCE